MAATGKGWVRTNIKSWLIDARSWAFVWGARAELAQADDAELAKAMTDVSDALKRVVSIITGRSEK